MLDLTPAALPLRTGRSVLRPILAEDDTTLRRAWADSRAQA